MTDTPQPIKSTCPRCNKPSHQVDAVGVCIQCRVKEAQQSTVPDQSQR